MAALRAVTRRLLESRQRVGRLEPGEDIELDVDDVLLADGVRAPVRARGQR